jgi:hypothetical protein
MWRPSRIFTPGPDGASVKKGLCHVEVLVVPGHLGMRDILIPVEYEVVRVTGLERVIWR